MVWLFQLHILLSSLAPLSFQLKFLNNYFPASSSKRKQNVRDEKTLITLIWHQHTISTWSSSTCSNLRPETRVSYWAHQFICQEQIISVAQINRWIIAIKLADLWEMVGYLSVPFLVPHSNWQRFQRVLSKVILGVKENHHWVGKNIIGGWVNHLTSLMHFIQLTFTNYFRNSALDR